MEQTSLAKKHSGTRQGNTKACANVGAALILCARTKDQIAS